jgi:hypothetical protein
MRIKNHKIMLYLPPDLMAKLPPPDGRCSGKRGAGRNGFIVEILRRELEALT